MNVRVYHTIEKAKQDYKFHTNIVYPLKCKSCNSFIKQSFGLFSCDCRYFVLNFKFGVHIKPEVE